MKNTIDIRIMASRKREAMVNDIIASLDGEEVTTFYDDEGIGCLPNAMRAWGHPARQDATHVMVLQDDVELAHRFVEICNLMVHTFPASIFALFNRYVRFSDTIDGTPYVCLKNKDLSGQCIIMPKRDAAKMAEFYHEKIKQLTYKHDDGVVATYAHLNDIPVFTTAPSLIQHICPTTSVINHSHNLKQNVSSVWQGRDVFGKADWTSGKYAVFRRYSNHYVPEFKEEIKRRQKNRIF